MAKKKGAAIAYPYGSNPTFTTTGFTPVKTTTNIPIRKNYAFTDNQGNSRNKPYWRKTHIKLGNYKLKIERKGDLYRIPSRPNKHYTYQQLLELKK